MPELPEVETIRRQLEPLLREKLLLGAPLKALLPQRLFSLKRYGKVLFMEFETFYLKIHLRLTGNLVIKKLPEKERHLLAIFRFEDQRLFLYDIRKFSEVVLLDKKKFEKQVSALGKDALAISLDDFRQIIYSARRAIKTLLLDQRKIAGLGNIYVDEILFRAEIHPLKQANTLAEEEVEKLYQVMKKTLKRAIELRGSSVRDYVDAFGEKGLFQKEHLVYGKRGKPCVKCGTELSYIKVAQRGTTFCPRCQKI